MHSTIGKCPSCRILYEWEGRPLLRDALCPACGSALRRTTMRLTRYSRSTRTPRERW